MSDAWRRLARESGIASVAYLPLVQQGEVVGLLAFYSHAASMFDGDEIRLLESIASEIAFAVAGDRDPQPRRLPRRCTTR